MKGTHRTILGALALIALIGAGIFLSERSSGDSAGTIRIGAPLAVTGDAGAWGEMSLWGARMAVEEINESDGINGQAVELIVEATDSTSREMISATTKLISVDKVDAIVGTTWLDVYHGPGKLVEGTDIVMITPDSGVEAINHGQKMPNVFSTWYRVDAKAKLLADHIARQGHMSAYLLSPNDSYYIDFSSRLAGFLEANNVDVINERVQSDSADVRTDIAKVAEAGVDAVFFSSYHEGALSQFMTTAPQILGDTSLYSDEILKDFVGDENFLGKLEGVSFFHATAPNTDFGDRFAKRYGVPPAFGAAPAYDTIYILADALTHAESDGVDAYIHSNSFDTISYGTITFDEIGGVVSENNQYELFVVENDVPVRVEW